MCIGSNRMRLVLIIITYLLFIPAGNTADFSKYKSTCSDIGFTPDTDPFADCVLELYKRDKIKIKAEVDKEVERQEAIEREKILQEENIRNEKAKRRLAERLKKKKEEEIKEQKMIEKGKRLDNTINAIIEWNDKEIKKIDELNELNDLNACISQCQSEDYTRSRAYCKRMCR